MLWPIQYHAHDHNHAPAALLGPGTLRDSVSLRACSVTTPCTTRSQARYVAILVSLASMIESHAACVTAQKHTDEHEATTMCVCMCMWSIWDGLVGWQNVPCAR